MSIATISTSIDNFITLGAGGYADGVTITSAGEVAPTFDAFFSITGYSFAVNLLTSAATLVNDGNIVADKFGADYPFLAGGGAYMQAGLLVNDGTITAAFADEGGIGVKVDGGSLDNAGLILGGGGGRFGGGVGLALSGGTATNDGTIAGGVGGFSPTQSDGVEITGGALTNTGLIEQAYITGNGVLTNAGLIEAGATGATGSDVLIGGSATLLNSGTIAGGPLASGGAQYGVSLGGGPTAAAGAELVNTGTIIGGVYGASGGTLTNAGTILESGTTAAVKFLDGNAELIIDPGAVFLGDVSALPSFENGQDTIVNHTFVPVTIFNSNVLDLMPGTAAGSLDLGGSFSGFNTIDFAPGAVWSLEGTTAELVSGAAADNPMINGFARGDTITLDGFVANGDTLYVAESGGLILDNGTAAISVDIAGSFVAADFAISTTGGNTLIELQACFAAGTRLLTPDGDTPVEALQVGNHLITRAGEEATILWIGQRRVDLRRHPRPETMRPIKIAAGAFADGVPARDLLLSPDHALWLDGYLVPVKALINNLNVIQLWRDSVVYYHVELTTHDIIFAERIAVETYLDTGNRVSFENGGGALQLHPEFAQAMRERKSCAPMAETGPVVEEARMQLWSRGCAIRDVGLPA